MAYIQFEHITKSFGNNRVLADVSLSVEKGKLITLLGPSGCGKSTLLRCLAGLESPDSGRIMLDNEDITHRQPAERKVSMVFQQYSLFPNLNVYDNIAFGLKIQKVPRKELRGMVREMLAMVELQGREHAFPRQLSGGQQQRVALARSLVTQPKVLLLDEPLSAIDARLRKSLQRRIQQIQRELNITCVFVTHDQDEAIFMSDVIHLMNHGTIEQSAAPIELYTSPRTSFAASFIGNYNVLTAAAFAEMVGGEAKAGDVAIRPETINLLLEEPEAKPDVYALPGQIREFSPHGNVIRYTVRIGVQDIHADVLFRSFKLFQPGQKVFAVVEKRNCLSVT
ncbi:MAG: ABC transporter ATP-binding protein [Candidatus Limiplasma sp.]|nr:ABC transporter ATP-binding protein [Candidatus Limiplasma sp.]